MKVILSAITVLFLLYFLFALFLQFHKLRNFFQIFYNNSNVVLISLSKGKIILLFNEYAQKITGHRRQDVIGKNISEFEDIKILFNENNRNFNKDINIKDDVWIRVKTVPFFSRTILIGNDVSESFKIKKLEEKHNKEINIQYKQMHELQKALESKYENLNLLYEKTKSAKNRYELLMSFDDCMVCDFDIKNNTEFYSESYLKFERNYTPPSEKTILGVLADLILEEFRNNIISKVNLLSAGEIDSFEEEYKIIDNHRNYRWINTKAVAVKDDHGRTKRIIGEHTDITKARVKYEEVTLHAFYDPLTGLPNRVFLDEKFKELENSNGVIGLVFINLDNFKRINETFGHSIGDEIMVQVAKRLSDFAKENIVVRYNSDEFIVIIETADSFVDVKRFADKLMYAFNDPFKTKDSLFYLTLSAGVAVYPDDGNNMTKVLKNADLAMRYTKDTSRMNYSFFTREMKGIIESKLKVEADMVRALEKGEFEVYYQPQIDMKTNKIVGLEALLRWNDPNNGIVTPGQFLNIIEETSLIIPIGKWILKSVCMFRKELLENGIEDIYFSVNISMLQLAQGNFVASITEIIEETGIKPHHICLEITENSLLKAFGGSLNVLSNLRNKGFQILLDDFGRGYSSITYLKQLPITGIKMDIDLVKEISEAENSLVELIIRIAHKIGLNVVAEGVEIQSEFDYLKSHNCDLAQGYFINKPDTKEKMRELLHI